MADAELKRLEAKEKKEQKQESGSESEEQEAKPKKKKQELVSENIIRMAETNLDGNKKVSDSIRRIRGISFMLSNAISKNTGLGDRKLGELSEQEREKLEEIILHQDKHGLPIWMHNRRKDPITGEDKHLAVSELDFTKKMDIDAMRKLKTYKGIRHSAGLPVRGQRTRGSFRKGKSVGVSRKKEQPDSKKK